MGMRDETIEELPETPPWLVKKGEDKNKIENYYGYTQALWERGDFDPAWDLPGKHAKNKDPKYMTKQDCIDYAEQYYFVDLDPEWTVHKLRGEVRKLRLNPPPPKPEEDEIHEQVTGKEVISEEDDQAIMDRLWEAGIRPFGVETGVVHLNPDEVTPIEEVDDEHPHGPDTKEDTGE